MWSSWASRRCSRSFRACRCSPAATTRGLRCCTCCASRCWRAGGWTTCVRRGVSRRVLRARGRGAGLPGRSTRCCAAARHGTAGRRLRGHVRVRATPGPATMRPWAASCAARRRCSGSVVAGPRSCCWRSRRRRGWRSARCVLVAADLAWAGMGYNPAIDRAVAVQPATRRDPRSCNAPRRSASSRSATSRRTRSRWTTRSPEARGYDLPVEERFDRLWRTQALARVPVAGRAAAGVHPAVAAQGRRRRGCAACPSSASATCCSPRPTRSCRAEGLRLVYDRPGRADLRATTPRCRGRSSWARSGASTTRYAAITAGDFDALDERRRRVGRDRGVARARRAGPDPPHRERPPGRSRSAPTRPGCSSSPTRGRRAGTPSWAARS